MNSFFAEILAFVGLEEDDWIIQRDIDEENNCNLVTNLPNRFESKMTKALSLIKEFVLDDRTGEKPVSEIFFFLIFVFIYIKFTFSSIIINRSYFEIKSSSTTSRYSFTDCFTRSSSASIVSC